MPSKPFTFSAIGGTGFDVKPGRKAMDGVATGWYGQGYDAVNHVGKRATPLSRVLSEDQELRQLPRRQLITSVRDLNRNFAIAAWMIRCHLNYVSTFSFRSRTGDKGLDREIEEFVRWYSLPTNCDPAGRHSLPRLVRMWESLRTANGDVLINRLADGRIQTIEGDRIQSMGTPFAELGIPDPRWVINGVWTNTNGRAIGYMVHKRPPWWTGLLFDRMVPARFADLFGYYERYDQVRGISPLSSAVNTLRDTYEGFDYALVKAKISQFFAMLITRQRSEAMGTEEEREGEADPNADPSKTRYDVDMGKGGVMLDLDPGDNAQVIESQQPSTQFKEFTSMMIMVALKALDLPYSFFDESHTNFSGSRMAGIQYWASAAIKQLDVRMLLDKLTKWRLGLAVADGEIKLPQGVGFRDLRWSWDHTGIPLYDPLKEISASIAAINAGLSSHEREAKRLGVDVYELIDEIDRVRKYAASKGVVLSTALPAASNDDPNKSATITEDQNVTDDAQRDAMAWDIIREANRAFEGCAR